MHSRIDTILFLFIAAIALASSPAFGESQIVFTDTCTLPGVGQSTSSCTLSSSIGGTSDLSYTRRNEYGGVQEIIPDGTTATGRFSSLTSSSVRYGILFDSFQFFESPTTNLQWSVSSTNSTCPGNTTYNWLLVRYRTPDLLSSNDSFNQPMDFSSTSQYVGGTMSYSSSTFTGVDYFDLASLTKYNSSSGSWSAFGFGGYNSASCSSGNYLVQASSSNAPMDTYGYMYFGANSFVDISVGGNPVVTVGVPQQNLTSTVMSGLANDVLTGFYTAYNAYWSQDQRTLYVAPNNANFSGSAYEFDLYQSSTNLNGTSPTTSALSSSSQNPSGQTQLGKITCTSLNSPTQGFCSGTADFSASGVSGTGNAVCEFYNGTNGHIMACTAQYPSNNHVAFSIVAQTPSTTTLANVVSNSGIVQLSSAGTGNLTVTLTNLTGRPIPTLGNPSDLSESSSLDIPSPFTKPSYSGAGACGTSLAGYGSCTLTLPYTTAADGASLATFRSAYDSGGSGTINATAIVIGTTGLSSIAVSSPTLGTSQNLTATGTFADTSTYDVTNAVTWSTSNSSVASVTNDLGNASNGYATIAASGIAKLTVTLGNIIGATVISPFVSGSIATIAGFPTTTSGYTGDGGSGLLAKVGYPYGGAIDSAGNLFIADYLYNRIQMLPTASVTFLGQTLTADYVYTVAGSSTGSSGTSGDSGAATSALLKQPYDVSVDSSGNFYIADTSNNRIQMVPVVTGTYFGVSMTAGDIYTIAGSSTGSSGSTGDGGAATAALFNGPRGVAVDSNGNVYIADAFNERVRMIAASTGTYFGQSMTAGYIYRLVGSSSGISGHTGNGGVATSALLYFPSGVAIDPHGNVVIDDFQNNRIQMVAKSTGTYFGQSMTQNYVYTVVGSPTGSSGLTGDGGAATSALLSGPYGVGLDSSGNLFVADTTNNRVQMVPVSNGTYYGQSMTANDVYTVAGNSAGTSGKSGDGGLATSGYLTTPHAVAIDSSGHLFIFDTGRIRMVPAGDGTYAGNGVKSAFLYTIYGALGVVSSGGSSDGNPAVKVVMSQPYGIALDSSANTYVATKNDNKVHMIPSVTGTYFGQAMTANYSYTIAGNGVVGTTGDGGIATSAELNGPTYVAVDSVGNVYITDTSADRIRMVPSATGTFFGQAMTAGYIYPVAGKIGAGGYSGDGGTATNAQLNLPEGVAVDTAGNLFISDTYNERIRMVPVSNGTYFGQAMTAANIYTIAGSSSFGSTGNGGPATSALFHAPEGIAVDSLGNLYIADSANYRIQMIPAVAGTYFGQAMTAYNMYTVAGVATVSGTSGNGGAATSAELSYPDGVKVDSSGNLYIADTGSDRILMVPATNGIYFGQTMTAANMYTVAGTGTSGFSGDGFNATSAGISAPHDIGIDSSGILYIPDTSNYTVRVVYP